MEGVIEQDLRRMGHVYLAYFHIGLLFVTILSGCLARMYSMGIAFIQVGCPGSSIELVKGLRSAQCQS
jgi:hypothetical protein